MFNVLGIYSDDKTLVSIALTQIRNLFDIGDNDYTEDEDGYIFFFDTKEPPLDLCQSLYDRGIEVTCHSYREADWCYMDGSSWG